MVDTRVKITSIVENQLPIFVREEFPLVGEFLSQYYTSIEAQSGVLDILQNIDQYIKLEQLTNLVDSTSTTSIVSYIDDVIEVKSTIGFPDSYGLLKIDSEIITYTSKTNTTFNGCIRGFSGISSLHDEKQLDHLVFSSTNVEEHIKGSLVSNLSILFLKEFFRKVKNQFVPGFNERTFTQDLNQNLFIKQAKDFYSTKGTDQSFEILFRALYGEDVEVIRPKDYLFIPSDAQYRVTKDLVVESLDGNPLDLNNRTLYQDSDGVFPKAYGSINNVEKIIRGNKEYYVISLDYDYNKDIIVDGSLFGEFSIHSQTKVTTTTPAGSSVIDVDSTVGFPSTGTLVVDFDNGSSLSITYTSKSYTQFYGCSGVNQELNPGQNIRINGYAYGYAGIGTDNIVKIRVTGVLSDLNIDKNTKYCVEGSKIKVRTLGKDAKDIRANNWIFNIPTTYSIDKLDLIDSLNFSYRVSTFDENDLFIGNTIKLFFTDGTEVVSTVSKILNKKTFLISGQGQLDISKKDKIQKLIRKTDSLNFPESKIYSTDVQNTYQDKDESFYVTSSSLPSYQNEPLTVKNKSIIFSGTFNGNDLVVGPHCFYTGDVIRYIPLSATNSLNIEEGVYFVKRVNSTTIRLARSRSNIYNENYISLSGTVTDNQIILNDLFNQNLDNQKLIRNIAKPQEVDSHYDTLPGPTGILVNGVEILNYKSKDEIFYGPLNEINVLSPGSNFDVINPPVLSISDPVGTGASGYCEVEGQFEKIDIIDGGFDYISDPIITITGGSGEGAKAKAQLSEFEHSVIFNAIQSSGQISLTNNTIGFSSYHKFRDGEKVVYNPDGQQVIGGLSTDSVYYASVQDSLTVKLHKTYNNAIDGIDPIDLTSYGSGTQRLTSFNLKKKISSVIVYDKGNGYKNRKISINSVGVNTFSNTINAKDHRYSTGEIIVYSPEGNEIGGLISGESYYVTVVDKDSFRLSNVGTSTTIGIGSAIVGITTLSDFYFKTNQYVDFTSKGSGYHNFNYPAINVTVNGIIGVSTRTNQNFDAVLQPIVRGEIKSVFLRSGGTNYGSEEILNFNRQPIFNLQNGAGAEVIPVISNGKIVEILISNRGYGYNSPPSFIISGPGSGAELVPVIDDGYLSEVKVIYGGSGYQSQKTTIKVVSAGSGAEFQSVAKSWTVNLAERNIQSNQITDDDGFIFNGINSNYGLQYTHLYAPRKLRQTILSTNIVNGQIVYSPDLVIFRDKESVSQSHSPIIGWAYDGNPIYGPYGYSTINGGAIKALKSGYNNVLKENRPSTSIYPEGFFVEDYEYQATGDLDEYNGRFCITPEFPNGVYAYFTTISSTISNQGAFKKFNAPVFPYFIGNRYKSKPNQYNFSLYSNQDDVDLNKTSFFRNTSSYNLLNSNSGYDFILNPNKIKSQNSVITYTKPGIIDSVGIKSSGVNYKVKDKIVFDDTNSIGQSALAEVTKVKGKPINQINVDSISISDIEFIPSTDQRGFYGFVGYPHNLKTLDVVTITGINTFSSGLEGLYVIDVRPNNLQLSIGVGTTGTTGIITYFNVFGNLNYPTIKENDVFEIDSEKVKILNIDPNSSRVKVLREYDGTVGYSHTSSSILFDKSRRFSFNPSIKSELFTYTFNRELYFDPQESLGIGTSFGIGIGATLAFSNPGVGITSLYIPTKSIYLPNHNLNTGDQLIYSSNGGNPISVSTNGISSFQLANSQILYAAKINNDLIGISTYRVGLGSNGSFVGINSSINVSTLYLTNIGSGKIHSFTTNYENVIKGEVNKNLVTVSTASTHGLNLNDSVTLECVSGVSTTYKIKYDDQNRRLVIDPKTFDSIDVNLSENSIQINSHGYLTGQKVIHNSLSPCGGLQDGLIYFIVKINNDKFKLSKTYYDAISYSPTCVDITSTSSGILSLVNPQITAIKNQSIVFDLSDSSLSYIKNFNNYSAFQFNFYTDSTFNNIFESNIQTNVPYITRIGRIGVDANASVTLRLSDNIPETLYYRLDPINYDENDLIKLEIIEDFENILDNNKLLVKDSAYSGTHVISGITSDTFSFNIVKTPERSSYISSQAVLSYSTNSLTSFGEIEKLNIISSTKGYKVLPGITTIISSTGSGALVEPLSSTIGNIFSTEIKDIGFEYSADKTLRPTADVPQIIKLSPLSSFNSIKISSFGKNYTVAPDLIVIDSVNNEIISDVDLRYNLGDIEVTILKNTKGINNKVPNIIPINNSNGVDIKSITFNNSTKEVTVGLAVSYSSVDDYPFSIGDKVLIENTSVGINTTNKGYNSSSYGYALFTLTSVDPNIGGTNGNVTYSLENYLLSGEEPGTFESFYSSGKIIPQKFFPVFDITLKKNTFLIGEIIESLNCKGVVEKWDSVNRLLIISSLDTFKEGELIIGSSSSSQGTIESILKFDGSYETSASSIVKKGWKLEAGFLNNDSQRLHDSDYYQYFSYSLKSKVKYEDWKDSVSSLNHTAGFKKFSNLIIESKDPVSSGISTEQYYSDFTSNVDFISEIDLNCVNDFDLSEERTLSINSKIVSDEIILKSKTLQDYFESIGNRVLSIDDISEEFNSNPRPTPFSSVDLFDLASTRSRKYITYVADKRYTDERQILLLTLLHNDSFAFLNQYGRAETLVDLGSFDFNIFGSEGQLLFYPTKYEENDYNISLFSYDLNDVVSGIGTTNLGDTVKISSSTKTINSGFSGTTTLVGIASTYRTSKILVQYSASDKSYFEYDELTVIHDGSSVELLEYGQLSTNNLSSLGSPGIGTYSAYLSGSNVNIDFTPNVGLNTDYYVNTLQVSIASTTSVGVSTSVLNTGLLDTKITSIPSSGSPTSNVVCEYDSIYSSAYYIVSIEDITNNQYQVSEITVVNDKTTNSAYLTEFGVLQTNSSVGEFSVTISGEKTQILFTPIANADIQIRVFQNALKLVDFTDQNTTINLTNARIQTGNGIYKSTNSDVKKSFDLKHKNLPIFKKTFDGGSSDAVNTTQNLLRIPGHFFVTGEKLNYVYDNQRIGIAQTTIVGIGITNKLPPTVYAIKIDDNNIRVASSAEDALKTIPIPLTISSVGVGTIHSLSSNKQNSRVLISIDNVIQSPIVATSITTKTTKQILTTDDRITVSGIASFFGSDLIKIDDEIMRIDTVGFGSTNVFSVRRSWMGTGISTHSSGSLVTKIVGDYNIVDNTLNFIKAPYGLVPIGTTSGSPDNVDYIGISTHSTFSGRTFLKTALSNTNQDTYSKNYVFDDISSGFTGYSTTFTLKSDSQNITGISTDNCILLVNQIFQGPQRFGTSVPVTGDYSIKENIGITSIQFTGSISTVSYDSNISNVPLGGVIVSIGSSKGFGYQPLVSAGGTAIVSGLGTISSISIGNSGSGYRSGIQIVSVGIKTEDLEGTNITYIGIASISNGNVVGVSITNPGVGYTSSNPPIVVFDSPLSYSNIPLIYKSPSSGLGTGAKVNIVVGQGSSIIDFEITNLGYGYGQGEVLTIGVGGTVGIPTNTSLQYKEFTVTVDKTQSDTFSGWSLGNLLLLDPLDSLFDGFTYSFPISVSGEQKSIRAKSGSNIDVQETLLVFINDVLQAPGKGYIFNGGSYIRFTEPPKPGDTSKILFYQGNSSVDVVNVDILETIKVGDSVKLTDDNIIYDENNRIVTKVNSIDSVNTNTYAGPGINANPDYIRPLTWCKQTNDLFINEKEVTKDRTLYEPLIYPTSNIIENVGTSSTVIYVESAKTFFDSFEEYLHDGETEKPQNKIVIISQDSLISAAATAVVSVAGTISSIIISDGGCGYSTSPTITIANPIGLGTTQRASASSTISIGGSVSSISISNAGFGYTTSNPPVVLIEQPTFTKEIIDNVSYSGDFGEIVGFGTTSISGTNFSIFDFYIPSDSYLRNVDMVGTAITISQLNVGDFFVVKNSNIGIATTQFSTYRTDDSIIGISTQFIDGIYQVSSIQTNYVFSGIGNTYIKRVYAKSDPISGITTNVGLSTSSSTQKRFYGEFSWGKINVLDRIEPKTFNCYGFSGINTSSSVIRINSLKYKNYVS